MKKRWLSWTLVLISVLALGAATRAGALTLSFSPNSQSVPLGSTASVDLVVSGLGDSGPPSLGTYDLAVTYDASILSLTGVTFGNGFGESSSDVDQGSTPGVGIVTLFALSLLSPEELDALQNSDSFTLATLEFDTLLGGVSPLTYSDVILGDAFGAALPLDSSPAGEVLVPEPSTALLLCLGLAALARRTRI